MIPFAHCSARIVILRLFIGVGEMCDLDCKSFCININANYIYEQQTAKCEAKVCKYNAFIIIVLR